MTGRRDGFRDFVILNGTKCSEGSRVHKGGCINVDVNRSFASAQVDRTTGKDGLVSWSVGQFKIRAYLVGYYKKLETFFISD